MSNNYPIARLASLGADAVYQVFGSLSAAPTLPIAAIDAFQDDEPLNHLQAETFGALHSAGYIQLEDEWTDRIDGFLVVSSNRRRAEEHLPDIERQLRTLEVQLKHAAEKRDRGRLLKSKTTQWEETNRHQSLETKRQALLDERARYQSSIDNAEEQLELLVSAIANAKELTKARWLNGQVARVTNDGAFLINTLNTMNKEHFRGRRLCDVLVVGPLLT